MFGMTVDERAEYQRHSEDIIARAKKLNETLPYGVVAEIAYNYKKEDGNYDYLKHLRVFIFSDVVHNDVIRTTLDVDTAINAEQLPADIPYKVVITTVAERKKILGDGWEFGMPDKHIVPKKRK